MSKCLYCYKELTDGEVDFHKGCAKKFFGMQNAPELTYSLNDLDALATQVIKPQTQTYKNLPENEDLTMHLAEIAKIKVVPHTLIRLQDGTLGYLTKRIDRTSDGSKIPMEDMCQLTERQTEYKYKSSYEQIAKVIAQYSYVPLLDLTDFYEQVFFSWLVGNNDMHLKNFSLYAPKGKWLLTPAYDLLNVSMANPKDTEEMALTLNGRKKRITKSDFVSAMTL